MVHWTTVLGNWWLCFADVARTSAFLFKLYNLYWKYCENGQSLIEANWLPVTVAMEHIFFQVTSALLLSTRHISTCQPMSPCSNGRHGKVCSLAARKVGKWGSKVIRLVEKTSGSKMQWSLGSEGVPVDAAWPFRGGISTYSATVVCF
jgi:hypothetical protein